MWAGFPQPKAVIDAQPPFKHFIPIASSVKISEGGPKFPHNRETSQTSFAFAKTAWFRFTFFYF